MTLGHNALIDAVVWPHIQVCCIYSIGLQYETVPVSQATKHNTHLGSLQLQM